MSDLTTLLELATDELSGPDLAAPALATARRRRARRRGAVAAVAAAAAVTAVLVAPRVVDPTPRPAVPGTGSPTPSPTPGPTPTPDSRTAPPIAPEVVLPPWDPATAADLPRRPIGHVPDVIAPAGGSGSRAGDTVGVLALSRDADDRLAVFYGETGWYGLEPLPDVGPVSDSDLSRDGSRMAVVGPAGLAWCPAARTCPSWTRVDVPGQVLGEDTTITWTRDASRLVLASFSTGVVVDLDTGAATELPYLADHREFDIAPDGRVVTTEVEPLAVAEWDLDQQARPPVETGDLGGLVTLVVGADAIAATRADVVSSDETTATDGDGLVVVDRGDLATRVLLPFGGEGQWVAGEEVQVVQWLDDDTLLFSVLDVNDETVRLVRLDTGSADGLGLVSQYPASFDVDLRDLGRADPTEMRELPELPNDVLSPTD